MERFEQGRARESKEISCHNRRIAGDSLGGVGIVKEVKIMQTHSNECGMISTEEPDGTAGGSPVMEDLEERVPMGMIPSDIYVSELRRGDIVKRVCEYTRHNQGGPEMDAVVVRSIRSRSWKTIFGSRTVIDVKFQRISDGEIRCESLNKTAKLSYLGRSMKVARAILLAEAL